MRESLIKIHRLLSSSAASILSNLRGGIYGHPYLTMATEDYLSRTGHAFPPSHNPGNYHPNFEIEQEKLVTTERFK